MLFSRLGERFEARVGGMVSVGLVRGQDGVESVILSVPLVVWMLTIRNPEMKWCGDDFWQTRSSVDGAGCGKPTHYNLFRTLYSLYQHTP
jgi:hypothetical protein